LDNARDGCRAQRDKQYLSPLPTVTSHQLSFFLFLGLTSFTTSNSSWSTSTFFCISSYRFLVLGHFLFTSSPPPSFFFQTKNVASPWLCVSLEVLWFSSTHSFVSDVFIGLNVVRFLSVLSLILVFSSNIVTLANDIKAVNAFVSGHSTDDQSRDLQYIPYITSSVISTIDLLFALETAPSLTSRLVRLGVCSTGS
jgi:hypothetical protein